MSPWSAIAVLWAACGCAASSSWGGLRGGGRDSPLQLIDASGTLSAAALSTLTAEAAPSLSLVASIGGKWRGRCLLNKAFGTSFSSTLGDPAPAGAALDGDASAWYLDCCAADGGLLADDGDCSRGWLTMADCWRTAGGPKPWLFG